MIFSPEREQRDAALELLAYAVGKWGAGQNKPANTYCIEFTR